MAGVADMQLRVDVRLGLDGPAGEAVALLREWLRTPATGCCPEGGGRCLAHLRGEPCVVARTQGFLAAIDAATDPKGAA